MNQVTNEQKESAIKTLAVFGFLVVIVLLVFVAVKLVSYLPTAWNSLASLADSVYNYERPITLTVSLPQNVIKSGEAFTFSWNDAKRPGTYSFSYECQDGVTLETKTKEGDIESINCSESYKLAKDQTSLEVVIATSIARFTDVTYTVTFTPSDPRLEAATTTGRVTIVNANIPTDAVVAPIAPTVVAPVEKPISPLPAPTTVEKPKPTTLQYVEQVIYAIPESNPNGKIDLLVTFLGVGTGSGKDFTLLPELKTGKDGSIRFSVKNIGTKTATDWSYKAELPSDITYSSGSQKALKPNEEAIITLNFTGIGRTGIESFGVTATAKGDADTKNNNFTWAVKVSE